jgi:hypothetical protein
MTNAQPYARYISYYFDVCGETLQIYVSGDGTITVSEIEFNGGEDTHQVMGIINKDGKWTWVDNDDEYNLFCIYSGKDFADAILEFLNEHGIPEEIANPKVMKESEQRSVIEELIKSLEWYISEDDTQRGDTSTVGGINWNKENDYWIEGQDKAITAIERARCFLNRDQGNDL